MTKLEEMIETFSRAYATGIMLPRPHEQTTNGLTAVLEKHIQPLLREAYEAGYYAGDAVDGREAKDYAARIIAKIKEKA